MLRRRFAVLAAVAAGTLAALAGTAAAAGITNGGSDLRDGWYADQPSLTRGVVTGSTFGRLWRAPVDGQVYAQPLVDGDTVLIATETNHVYGLDAQTGAARWERALGTPFDPRELPDACNDLLPAVGITGTPVVDQATHTAYFAHKTYGAGHAVEWWLDALDTRTGATPAGFPVRLGGHADNADVDFSPLTQMQRPGLLLLDGVVYVAFGGHCDIAPYQGWVFGVSTAGQVRARWTAVSQWNGAGIWQSGSGLMSDGPGRIFLSTGNGGSPASPRAGSDPGGDLGESVVRLAVQPDGGLRAADFFAPYDAADLDTWDADFASGGVTALRDAPFGTASVPHPAVAVGKSGYVYLLNRDALGGFRQGPAGGDAVVQRLGPDGGVWSRPAVWPGDGGWVYIPTASAGRSSAGGWGVLNAYAYGVTAQGRPSLALRGTSTDEFGFGSSAPVVTSSGTASGTAIVWLLWSPDASGRGAQLRAYDPVPRNRAPVLLGQWPVGVASKFAPPGVGSGRLYVGTRDGSVLAYGAPVTATLDAPATQFETTTVGQSSSRSVTLTATGPTTLRSITASPAEFGADDSGLGLPRTLAKDQTVTVPVRFTPSAPGLVGGSLRAVTDEGTYTFGLSGSGQAAQPQLDVTPPVVSFGGTTAGQTVDDVVTLRNVGNAPLDITGLDRPAAPFTVDVAPSTLAPGASADVAVQFQPTAAGSFTDELVITSSGGTRTVGLSGSAGIGPRLDVPAGVDLGSAVVGSAREVDVVVRNSGDAALTITKSKPPAGGPFSFVTALDEGTTVAAGATRTVRVRFAPAAAGPASATWTVTGNDGGGAHVVQLSGNGVAPDGGGGAVGGDGAGGGGVVSGGGAGGDSSGGGGAAAGDGVAAGGGTLLAPIAPGPDLAAQGAVPARARPQLWFARSRIAAGGARLVVRGTLSQLATGRVTLIFAATVGGRSTTVRTSAPVRLGRFTATLRLPSRVRAWRRARVEARYAGSARVQAGTAALVLVRR